MHHLDDTNYYEISFKYGRTTRTVYSGLYINPGDYYYETNPEIIRPLSDLTETDQMETLIGVSERYKLVSVTVTEEKDMSEVVKALRNTLKVLLGGNGSPPKKAGFIDILYKQVDSLLRPIPPRVCYLVAAICGCLAICLSIAN
ncbi:hypothetical protein [Agrobacterium pusense]|uniref:hypothetical protein n=1 Tax=Agrobacterium pusense TaxID=648995 RepID=UPI0022B898CA|nr:hypothetical protein [Agrobacterium pusense]MCZ7926171.1 hypothetical protein [Agrobacterium pusense]